MLLVDEHAVLFAGATLLSSLHLEAKSCNVEKNPAPLLCVMVHIQLLWSVCSGHYSTTSMKRMHIIICSIRFHIFSQTSIKPPQRSLAENLGCDYIYIFFSSSVNIPILHSNCNCRKCM